MDNKLDSREDENEPQSIIIRSATNDDEEEIYTINLRSWGGGISTHELLELRHGQLNNLPWIEQIAQAAATHILEEDVKTFVAESNGRVIGYASAQLQGDKPEVGIVSYNAVDPDHRGQGVGTALVKHVMNYLKTHGARVLLVWTLEADEPACRIYERLGFEELTRFVYYSYESQS